MCSSKQKPFFDYNHYRAKVSNKIRKSCPTIQHTQPIWSNPKTVVTKTWLF